MLIGRYARRRFDGESIPRMAAVLALSVALAVVIVALGQLWAFALEGLRVGSGHLSYRAARIPWTYHRPLTFALAAAIGCGIALLPPRATHSGTNS